MKIGIAIKGAQKITQNKSSLGQYKTSILKEKEARRTEINKKESVNIRINCL